MPETRDLFLTQGEEVLVPLQLELALALLPLPGRDLLLELLFLVFKLVLDALDVQLQLLLDLYVIPHLGLVLLKHRLVFARSLLTTHGALAFVNYVVSLCVRFASAGFSFLLFFALFRLLLLLHFHVHEDLNAGLDVL